MEAKPNSSQTAYLHNAPSSVSGEVNDHGWANAINRMIDQQHPFLALKYESSGYLFRGMSSGFFEALLDNKFWHYSGDERGTHFEKELDVLLVSQDFSDALTVSKLWEQQLDACIVIFRSEIFNQALSEKKAAMLATAEPGVVFKYPFITYPLSLDSIEYFIISADLLGAIKEGKKISVSNKIDNSKLSLLITEMHAAGKLLIPDLVKENYNRSDFEQASLVCLSTLEIAGAKAVNSDIKPSRKA